MVAFPVVVNDLQLKSVVASMVVPPPVELITPAVMYIYLSLLINHNLLHHPL